LEPATGAWEVQRSDPREIFRVFGLGRKVFLGFPLTNEEHLPDGVGDIYFKVEEVLLGVQVGEI